MSRIVHLAGLAGLVTTAIVVLPGGPALADPSDWCSPTVAAPCILAVARDGVAVSPTDPTWQVDLGVFVVGHEIQWNLRQSGSYELTPAAAGRWEVTTDMGTIVPRVSYGNGRYGKVKRIDDGDGTYRVVASAEPTLVASGCDNRFEPWTCPTDATTQALRLAQQIVDQHQWNPPVQRKAFYGVDFWTNIEVTSFPPGVNYDDATGIAAMRLDFGAPHFETDGTTVYRGHFEAVLPNDFLRENFYIPDPGTVTPASLLVTGAGPISTTSVTKATPSDPAEIEVTDMTFSIRKLRVKTGTVVPTKARNVKAKRVKPGVAKLRYGLAKPRGAKVKGYQGKCTRRGSVVKDKRRSNTSPLRITGLAHNKPYTCRVRALSKVGPGPWSKKAHLARRP